MNGSNKPLKTKWTPSPVYRLYWREIDGIVVYMRGVEYIKEKLGEISYSLTSKSFRTLKTVTRRYYYGLRPDDVRHTKRFVMKAIKYYNYVKEMVIWK